MNYIKLLCQVLFVLISGTLLGADRYWVGATNNNWNETGNWSTTSGGMGGASIPGAGDRALFNSSGNVNLTLDVAPTIESIDISVGYTAIIDLNGNNLTINGATTNDFEDGTFNNTSGGSISITSTGITYFRGSVFNPNVTCVSARLYLNGSRFNGTAVMEKNDAGHDAGTGGNVFNGGLTMTNAGSGYFMTGNGTPDTIIGNLIMTNTGSHNMYLAYNSAGTYISGNLTISNNGSSGSTYVYVSDITGSSTTVDGNLLANNVGSADNNTLYLGDAGALHIGGLTTVTNNVLGTNGTVYFGTQTTGSATLVGNVTLTNSSLGATNSNVYLGNNGTVNCSGRVDAVNSSTATSHQVLIANGANSSVTIAGATSITNNGSGTTGRCWLGNSGSVTFSGVLTIDNSSTATNSEVFCHYATGSINTYNDNIIITNSNAAADGILFGSNGGSGTLVATKTLTIGGAGFSSGELQLRNFTQTGSTAQSITLTGSGYMYNYDSDWGGNVTFVAPRMITRGTRYRGTASLTKNGATNDQCVGGNVFEGIATLTCSGADYLLMGNGTPDTFKVDLTLVNTGQNGIYLGYNSAGNYVGGNLSATNSGTGASTWIYLSDAAASTLQVDGNVDITVNGTSTTCVARLGNTGSVEVAGNVTWVRSTSSVNSDCYIANSAASTVNIAGDLSYTQTGGGTSGRMFIGNAGSVSVGGTMTLVNSSSASNSQIYCNNASGSVGTYNGNIVVANTVADADGIYFGSGAGVGTLAATRTITVGAGGFISGDLYFRNFTQTGATPQTLANTGEGYIYNYDCNWGGNVSFSSGRIITRGTRYGGTAIITKNGPSDDQCVGGNVFGGNTTLNCTNDGYLMMGNGSPDSVNGNLTLLNSGTRGIYLGYNSSGNYVSGNLTATNSGSGTSAWIYLSDLFSSTLQVDGNVDITVSGTASTCGARLGNTGDVTVNGNVTWNRTSSVANSDCYIATAADATVIIGGNLTYTQSGGGTNGRMFIGSSGDITIGGTMTLTNSSTATSNHIFCNDNTGSVGVYNGNIVLESTTADSDGHRFGASGGSATLAATKTISVGGGGYVEGDIYLFNFTQIGATAQTLTNTGTGYIYNSNSIWGGNVNFSSGRILTNNTTYQGTLTLSKTNAIDDRSLGGNTISGTAILNNSGSGYFLMGDGSPDSFGNNLTMNNSGTNSMYLAYRAVGTTVAGNLTMNNTSNGTTGNLYLCSIDTSTLSVTGNLIVNNSATASNSAYAYLAYLGTLTVGGDMTVNHSATATNSYIYLADGSSAAVNITGNLSVISTSSASNSIVYIGDDGNVTIGGNLVARNQASGTTGQFYIAQQATSTVSIGGTSTIENTGAGTTKRVYLGNLGDITFGSDLDIKNTSSATNSEVYCNHQSGSVNAYNGNITLESSHVDSDGILFGSSGAGGSGTLAATKTVTASGGGITAGDIYFKNFTQIGATAQTVINSGPGYIYNYDSDWGGNVVFSGGRMYTTGTTYRGTATLSKTGAIDDASQGGNSFAGDVVLNNSGSRYFLMGNGSPDVFGGNVTMNNTGDDNMYLAYNSAGNTIAGNLTVNHATSGTNSYFYISDYAASTLSIGGNAIINNTSSASNSIIHFSDDGDITITGNLTLNNSGTGASSHIYASNVSTSTLIIGGNTTITNSGAGTTNRVYFGNQGSITQTGSLDISNTSTATNSQVYCNHNSNSVATYGGNITIASTNASTDGVFFGNAGGSATLAATRTISVGAGGFIGGDIYLRNFTQVGPTAQTLINAGSGYLYNYDSDWGGNVVFSGGRMYTTGTTYRGTATLSKTDASDDASPGGNSFAGDVILNNSGSRYFGMGNGSPDIFGGNLTMNNSGTYHMYLGQNSAGNTIAGNLVVNNNGSGATNYSYISNATASTITVGGTGTFTNSSTATTSYIYVGDQGDITFNNNVTLTNSGTGDNGYILMANNTNSVVIINGNLDATNSASGTTKSIYLTNIGNLTVSGNVTATNSSTASTGEIYIGNNSASIVSIGGNSTWTNSGAGTTKRCYFGNYGDVAITGNLSISNSSSASNSEVYCNDRTGSVNTYGGNITIESSNADCDGVRFGQNGGSGTLAATKTITVSGGGFIAGELRFRNFTQTGATAQALTLTGTAYMIQYDANWGGNVVFSAPRFYTYGTTYSGTASLEKSGDIDDASPGGNTFIGNCTMLNSGTGYFLMGNGTPDTWGSDLTMTTTGTDHSYIAHNSAGNSIAGNFISTNNGTDNVYHYISTSGGSSLSIGGNTTLNNSGSGDNIHTYFGNSGDVTLSGSLIATNSASGVNGYLYVGNSSTSDITIGGNATFSNSGAGTTKRTYLGSQGNVSISGDLSISNSSSASNSEFYCNNSASSSNTYGGNIILEATDPASDGIQFGGGGGTATQSAGGNISIGGGGFVAGTLYLRNFTQLGSAASSLTLTGSSILNIYDSDFGGNFTGIAPQNYSRGTTYRSATLLTKTGATNDASAGGNSFNGDVTFTNSGTGYFMQGNGTPDDYNGNVSYIKSSTGLMYPSYASASTYAGDININSADAITFAAHTGTIIMDGTGAQSINDLAASTEPVFRRFTLSNSSADITLNMPISVSTTMTFTSGNLVTTSTNLLYINDEATVSGASDNSHVDGPVEKIGNNAFEFPVGDGTSYRPISMSAPNSNASRFRAQYTYTDPGATYGTSLSGSIDHISTREFWNLDRINPPGNVTVTIGWNPNSGGVDDLNELTVARWDGSTWQDQGNGGTSGNTTAGTVQTAGAVSSFSPFTLASTTVNNPLPVELLSFAATFNEETQNVDLEWVTSSEVNNDFFLVEKTNDLKEFEEVVRVEGQGTTNEKTEYREKDQNPSHGITYYRLSQTDLDGSITYFDLQKIVNDPQKNISDSEIELFPNPNNGKNISIKIPSGNPENINITITDFLGKAYLSEYSVFNQDGHSIISIEMSQKLPPGSYMISLNLGNEVYTYKLIVQ
ncbi:MAG: T9SS type A sorting domain-containing protein [Flavobacteriales bacterium]|nr:T9SS type A sorting domain-containing protein [Flavobacteriales bacterium]